MANQSTIKPIKKIISPVTVPAQPGRVRQLREKPFTNEGLF